MRVRGVWDVNVPEPCLEDQRLMMSQVLLVSESQEPPKCWDEWLESAGSFAGARQTCGRAIQYAAEYGGLSYFVEARRGGDRVAGMLVSWVPAGGRFGRAKRLAEKV